MRRIPDGGSTESTGHVLGEVRHERRVRTKYTPVALAAEIGPESETVDLANLAACTTYHYEATAENGTGTSYGQDETFTTGCSTEQVLTVEGGGGSSDFSGPLDSILNGPTGFAVGVDSTAAADGYRYLVGVPYTVVTDQNDGTVQLGGQQGDDDVEELDSGLTAPKGVAVSPDGSTIYVSADVVGSPSCETAGVVYAYSVETFARTTVAGGNLPSDCSQASADDVGDGGAATSAVLDDPVGLAVGPDGTIYVADQAGGRPREVSPSGTISTLAGSATTAEISQMGYVPGNGSDATDAMLDAPAGLPSPRTAGSTSAKAEARTSRSTPSAAPRSCLMSVRSARTGA